MNLDNQSDNSAGEIGRRQFIVVSWVGALIGLFAQTFSGLMRFMTPVLEEGAFGTEVRAGRVEEFDIDTVDYFRDSRFYLVRLDEGFLALYRKCPHLGCVVPWDEEAGHFNCPCHTSLFTMRGEVTSGPSPRPLDLFPVTIRDGEVFVNTGQIVQRHAYDSSQAASTSET